MKRRPAKRYISSPAPDARGRGAGKPPDNIGNLQAALEGTDLDRRNALVYRMNHVGAALGSGRKRVIKAAQRLVGGDERPDLIATHFELVAMELEAASARLKESARLVRAGVRF